MFMFANSINSTAHANTLKKISMAKAGRIVATAINTLLSGKGEPKSTLGINGDFYLDVNKMNMFGPKTKNKWPAPVSLKGASGTNGKNGATGATGAKGSSSSGSDGAQGLAGPAGVSVLEYTL